MVPGYLALCALYLLCPAVAGRCGPEETPCQHGCCVPLDSLCGCGGGSHGSNSLLCDFESDFCACFPEELAGISHWQRVRATGHAVPGERSPGYHKGHYVWMAGGSGALLRSPLLRLHGPGCQLHFYYSTGGRGRLNVWLHTAQGKETAFHTSQATNGTWSEGRIAVDGSLQEFQVVFEGNAEDGFVALDGLRFSGCGAGGPSASCCGSSRTLLPPTPPPTAPTLSWVPANCPPHTFSCPTGKCIDQTKVCDFTLDCPGGEDEALCSACCDFEQDSCGWREAAPGDGFDWTRSSAAAVPQGFYSQRPPRDHTTNSSAGSFMFALKNGSSLAQRAFLRSPWYSQAASGCFMTFWHYNSGHSVGAAEMHMRTQGVGNVTVLWRSLYDQGRQWHPVRVQLGRLTRPFQFSVIKLSLGVYDGVSALDDIFFLNCSLPPPVSRCPEERRFHCSHTRSCVDRRRLCDLVDDCGDGSDEEGCSRELQCSFEEGLCNWTQERLSDAFDWTHMQGPTPTLNTGPWKDHTLGHVDGHYLYIEASAPQHQVGSLPWASPRLVPEACWDRLRYPPATLLGDKFMDTAILVSRPFQPTVTRPLGQPCLFRLHYHMLGKHVFRLAVYLRTSASGRGQLLWARFGEQGNLWHRMELVLLSGQPFQIVVEGTVGDDFNGDIAIDDLSFLHCQPYYGDLPSVIPTTPAGTVIPSTPPTYSCAEGQLACKFTGDCVDLSQRCDFHADCSDGTDELDCVKATCDFEADDTCGWHHNRSSVDVHPFHWVGTQGQSVHHGEEYHRPVHDHTLNTSDGWYVYADSSNGRFGHMAELSTPVISATGPRCTLVFWYHMSGFTVGSLQVFGKSGNVSHELWSQTGNQGYRWRRAEVFLGIRYNLQVILRAKRGISYMGDVALDDVSFQACAPLQRPERVCEVQEFACSNLQCIPVQRLCDFINDCGDWSDEKPAICRGFAGSCSFEFDLCSWHQCEQDDFDWLSKDGGSSSAGGKGPSTDHTLREPTGHYIYIKSSFPQAAGDVARLSSPTLSWRSRNCKIVFYLHMSGDRVGTLSVFQTSLSQHRLLLNLTGDQGHYWLQQEVPLTSHQDFWVTFEGTVGSGAKGEICLDDITFSSACLLASNQELEAITTPPGTDSCPSGHLPCGDGECFRLEHRCNFVADCGDGADERDCGTSCTFETGRCGWGNSLADSFDWTLGTGSVQSFRPPADHTLESQHGHFVYLEAKPVGLKGDKAHMRSAVWKESSATCKVTFWYFLSARSTGIIRLLVKTDEGLTEVWSMAGNHGDQWNQAEVPLRKLRNFQLIFEGIRVRDVSGGAALDDVDFSNCAPNLDLPPSCPAVTDFVCQNGDCIESHLLCDGKADCADGSDEIDCRQILDLPGACNFNMPVPQSWEEVCQLHQNTDDDFDWKVGSSRETAGTGPAADHSPDGRGQFLYISSGPQREGDTATVTTQTPFPASIGVCHLRFWYHMYGSWRMGTLKVYTVGDSGARLQMWAVSGNHGDRWNYASVPLSNTRPFKVAFEAEAGGDMWTDIAVDDLSFTSECAVGAPVTRPPPTCDPGRFQCLHVFQCIPQSWQCDGEEDCADLSDEEPCPSRVPGTVPPQELCDKGSFQCGDSSCLPSLLRCDGVRDCPHGEDEFGCPVRRCSGGALLCERTHVCIPTWQRCDGSTHCLPFQPDESSCDECPPAYCLHGGTCYIGRPGPLCLCRTGWVGNRCHVQQKPSSPSTLPQLEGSGLDGGFATLWMGLAVLLVGSAGAAFVCVLRKVQSAGSTGTGFSSMENPVYKFPRIDEAPISVYPWRHEELDPDKSPSRFSFANPLYQPAGGTGGHDAHGSHP